MWRRRRYVIFLITQFDDNCKVFIEVHVTVSVTENFLPEIHILLKKKCNCNQYEDNSEFN